jgi:hypothetical protein
MSAFGPTLMREAATYRQLSLRDGVAPVLNTDSVFVVDRKSKLAPWFFATPISDEMTCDILRGAPDGCFLVRASRIPDCFILSYRFVWSLFLLSERASLCPPKRGDI